MQKNTENTKKGNILAIILITSLFFLWGMANNLNDILIPQFKKVFTLTDLQSGLVQSAFYMGYFILAIPAAIVMEKYGYKTAIIFGLVLFAAGAFLFYPAAEAHSYNYFLFALFVLASGLAFLETSANPLIIALGDKESAAFRLNLAQSFNPLGSLTGIFIGKEFILSGIHHDEKTLASMDAAAKTKFYETELLAVQTPYIIIGCVLIIWAIWAFFTSFPTNENTENKSEKIKYSTSFIELIKKPKFRLGVIAQFFYVGAQVGIWSYIVRYAGAELGLTDKQAANYILYSLIFFVAGRFIGTYLIKVLNATRILQYFAGINIIFCAIAIIIGGQNGLWALVASSFFMSIMFPTIFAVSINDAGIHTKAASSLLVMSIIGGAVLTPLMGLISDNSAIRNAIIIPFISFAVILFFAYKMKNEKVSNEQAISH